MKITATYGRKMGMPNYGSISAGCTVEIDVKSSDAGKAREAIVAGYAIAVQAVEEHLRGQLAALTPGPEPDPEPEPGPVEDLRPPGRGHVPPRRAVGGGGMFGGRSTPAYDADAPRDGRQLLAMVRRWSEEDETDYQRALSDWARDNGHPWRVVDWDLPTVAGGQRYLMTLRNPAPGPEPARNGRPVDGRAAR